MKIFFVATVVGVLLIAGGVFFDSCIGNFSVEMLGMCQSLEEKIGSEEAVQKERELREYLEERHLLLASIINHDHIDEIEICITELKGYLAKRDWEEARVKCEKLKLLLERLPKEYGVSLENIL